MSTEAATGPDRTATRSPGLMLALATIGFAVNFWAWALLSPLGPLFRDSGTLGALSESEWHCSWPCRSSSARWAGSRWAR